MTGLWLLTLGLSSLAGPILVGTLFDAFGTYRFQSGANVKIKGVVFVVHTRVSRINPLTLPPGKCVTITTFPFLISLFPSLTH